MKNTNYLILTIISLFWLAISASFIQAQSTEFTFQGRLTDSGNAATGNYDLQFSLFDNLTAGTQLGSTVSLLGVPVSNGIFTVRLDFGGQFTGAARHLQIAVKTAGNPSPYAVLNPRQAITSAPYAIRSLNSTTADTASNSTQLGGINANQYIQTTDSRLSDDRNPTAGSASYIQNTTVQQPASNFNISGNATAGGSLSANVVNATTQYNLGGVRILSNAGLGGNLFAGAGSGVGNGTGNDDSFFGFQAGQANFNGSENAFFGTQTGQSNTSGNANAFFGWRSGNQNKTGNENSFFGAAAGANIVGGNENSFFGARAGLGNAQGQYNTFVGSSAGFANNGSFNAFFGESTGHNNTLGYSNTFIGQNSGKTNTTGDANTLLGTDANVGASDLLNATAIGASAQVDQGNSLVLGSIKGVNSASADTKVGIGTTAPKSKFHVADNNGNIQLGNAGCNPGFAGIGFASTLTCNNYSLLGDGSDTIINRPSTGVIEFRENNITQMSIASGGRVSINTLGSAGLTPLCRNNSNQISSCSSSLRYKKNIMPFTRGLNMIKEFHPITFDWKDGGMHDLGLGAEDVAKVNELLVIRNEKGEVEGVKYDRIGVVLINAVKEQQAQIEAQQKLIQGQQSLLQQQQQQLANLQKYVYRKRGSAATSKRMGAK